MMKISSTTPLPRDDFAIAYSIVRLNNSHIGKQKILRRTPLIITNLDTQSWILRYAMGNNGSIKGLTKKVIALDYDAISELGIQYNQRSNLEIRKASLFESLFWLMWSPDLNIRLNTRFALLGTILGIVSLIITFIVP